MIRKTLALDASTLKVVDEAQGIVTAVVNATGITDLQRDVMELGCWASVIAAAKGGQGKYPVICREHDPNQKVGKAIDMEELAPGDQRLGPALVEQNAGGLQLTIQYNMAKQAGRDAFSDIQFLKDQIEWSVGFLPDDATVRYDSKGLRHIGTVQRLLETSDVLMGASPGTYAASAKSATISPEDRKVRTAERLTRARAILDGFRVTLAATASRMLKAEDAKARFQMDDGKYPIDNCADVEDAWNLRNHSTTHTAEQVARHVRHAANELGCDGPWNDGSGDGDKVATASEQKAGHSHYHVHPDGTAHSHAHGHGADVADHDGPAEKVPHQHGHPVAEENEAEPKAALCCNDCKGPSCPGCCDQCCQGAAAAAKGMDALPTLTDDEAVHNGPLQQVLDGLNTLIAQEIAEGGYGEYGDIIRLCCMAQDAISWAQGEQTEYGLYDLSIWDLFAAGKEALSSKTENPKEPADKVAPADNTEMPSWLKAAILATSEADLTSSHSPNPAKGGGDGHDWERSYVDRFAGHAIGVHLWLQRDLHGEPDPQRPPAGVQEDVNGPPDEWAERFTSPWRQQQP